MPALGCGCLALIALGVVGWSVLGRFGGAVVSDAPPPVAPVAPPPAPLPAPASPPPKPPAEETGGGFDRAHVRRALDARSSAIRRCYERELANDPSLAGRVELGFQILPNGTVRDARATENTLQSPALAGCLVDIVSRLRFVPAPAEPTTFSFPFDFHPSEERAPPSLRIGDLDVRGRLSRAVVHRVARRHLSEVRACATGSGVDEGRVMISFIIAPTGSVQSAGVGSSTIAPALAACIASAVRRWTFPAPEGGGVVGVNLPFVFQRE